jgi:hypothetical protein
MSSLKPWLCAGVALLSLAAAPLQDAWAQSATVTLPQGATTPDGATTPATPAPAAPDAAQPAAPVQPQGGSVLMMRGLEKITGRPTDIVAPIGKPVKFATLTITARYCYSTPPSETPETAAFVQIDDQRPEQGLKRVFSGWMYASSPGLNGMEHPLYDVWAISCNNNGAAAPSAVASTAAPIKVGSPDSSDKEQTETLPEDAGK